MQRLASQIIGSSIFSVHAGGKIAEVTGILVRRKDLKVQLFAVKPVDNDKKQFLLSSDIRAYDGNRQIIDSYQDMSEEDELIRHHELIKDGGKLIGSKVVTQSGKHLGKVLDFSIDTTHHFANKIHVRATWPQRLIHERLIIDRSDIVDITDNKIIVRDATVKAKSTAKVLPA